MRHQRSPHSRFIWGIFFLVLGALALATNLGFRIPRDVWDYWPALLIALGVVQLAWPGLGRERFNGFWLIAIGVYGWISVFELFGLNWGTSWPILIVALGIRIILRSLFERDRDSWRGNWRGNWSSNRHGNDDDKGGAQ